MYIKWLGICLIKDRKRMNTEAVELIVCFISEMFSQPRIFLVKIICSAESSFKSTLQKSRQMHSFILKSPEERLKCVRI